MINLANCKTMALCLLFAISELTCISQTNVTSLVDNPGFEINGLQGWDNDGFWIQTNTATTSQGWSKTGTSYAEKWVPAPVALENASLTQTIFGMEDGLYTVQASAHAVLESNTSTVTKGVNLFAGVNSVGVNKGKTYSTWAVVVNGHLKIGIKVVDTDANWVAIDNIRLTKEDFTDLQLKEYAGMLYDILIADTLDRARQIYFNREQIKRAVQAYNDATDEHDKLIEAVKLMELSHEKFDSIKIAYTKVRDQANDLYSLTNRSGFSAADSIKTIRSLMTRYYRSSDDHYDWVVEQLGVLENLSRSFDAFMHLSKVINAARSQLIITGYPDNGQFNDVISDVVEKMKTILDVDDFAAEEEKLRMAQEEYLKYRPDEWITIINGNMWHARNGDVQAHAPGFVRVGDVWYMVGEDRTRSPDVNLYSSVDLINWNFEKKIIENGVTSTVLGNGRMIERPKLLYNPKTEKFVVWCHWEQGDYGASEAACFYSDEVNGVYVQAFAGRPLGIKSRDCNVFVDNDGTAYFISTTEDNNHLGLFQLSDDYLSVVNHTQLFPWQGREAPAIVRIGNLYYMFSSACSGWEPNQCKIAVSTNLRNGWSELKNVGNDMAFDTQAAAILTVKGTKDTSYFYVGDRWQDPGLPESKTIIFPVKFNGTQCEFKYRERFDINFVTGQWRDSDTQDVFLDKNNWRIVNYSSQETQSEDGRVANAIDNKEQTIWHTKYTGSVSAAPHTIDIDLGEEAKISGFLAMPRMDALSSGLIRQCSFAVSNDGVKWTTVYTTGWLPYGTTINFEPREARYVRLSSNDYFISLSELNVKGVYSEASGIDDLNSDNHGGTVDVRYYSINGVRLSKPLNSGIMIVESIYNDGTVSIRKTIK